MSSDGTPDPPAGPGASGGRPAYNRPRRYPVQTPAPTAVEAPATIDVTRQNPTLADAAQEYGRRHEAPPPGGGPADVPAAGPQPPPYPYAADGGPPGYPPRPAAPAQPGPSQPGPSAKRARTPSTRVLVVAAAVVVVLAVVIGLIVGLSGGDDGPQAGGNPGPTVVRTSGPPVATATPSTSGTTSASAGGGNVGAPPATTVCATLGATTPFSSFVATPRPAERLPATYVEPQRGTKIAACVGLFRPGAGSGRGRLGYLAEYEQLPATQYALTLKTLGWTLVPNLPRPTYRNSLRTTVTLVQQGTSLVTVVGDGS